MQRLKAQTRPRPILPPILRDNVPAKEPLSRLELLLQGRHPNEIAPLDLLQILQGLRHLITQLADDLRKETQNAAGTLQLQTGNEPIEL